jgi:hypothetical protein
MTIVYALEEKDYLNYFLFSASKSDRVRKNRWRNKVIIPVAYLSFGIFIILISQKDISWFASFALLAILWFFIYPVYERGKFIRHYNSRIKENAKELLHKLGSLQIDNDYIYEKDNANESKFKTTEIVEITEISSNIFIKLNSAKSIVIPKDRILEIEALIQRLKDLAAYLNIQYNIENEWKWK